MEQQLEQALEDAIEKRTFSLEALAAIETLRQEKEEAEARNKQLQKMNDAQDKKLIELSATQSKLRWWEKRENELIGREKACITTEIEKKFATIRGNEFHTLLDNLTRNIGVHTNIYGSRDVADQYGSVMPRGYTHTEETEAK